jgi:hypothetical protein
VLHLAGRVAFGVDAGDLLELERAFEGDGVMPRPRKRKSLAVWRDLATARLVQELDGKNSSTPIGCRRKHPPFGTMLANVFLQVQQVGGISCLFLDF